MSDWAANDATGASQNSWWGLGTNKILGPSADSSNTGFVNGAGSSSPLYPALESLPPVGQASGSMTSTSQIYCSASSTTDDYVAELESYATAGLSSGSTVVLVQPIASISGSTTTSLTGGLQSTANPTITETTRHNRHLSSRHLADPLDNTQGRDRLQRLRNPGIQPNNRVSQRHR